MRCECCGRETEVLIEIGAISPKVSVTGQCCTECCAYILHAVQDVCEDGYIHRAEFVSVKEKDVFTDDDGCEIPAGDIRFGLTDAEGLTHYFSIRRHEKIPEMEAVEIYPKKGFRKNASGRTAYSFRVFGIRKTEKELLRDLLMKLEIALLNPVLEKYTLAGGDNESVNRHSLRERGYMLVEGGEEENHLRIDGRLYSPEEFAKLLDPYERFMLTYQIRDPLTACPPDRDTYYLPVRITDEILLDDLERLIRSVSGRFDFISYKDMPAFHEGFSGIYDKLELYCKSNVPGIGKAAGLKLIHRLEELETDDDVFPEYQIELIRWVIGEA